MDHHHLARSSFFSIAPIHFKIFIIFKTGSHCVVQFGLELFDLLAFTSKALEQLVCTNTLGVSIPIVYTKVLPSPLSPPPRDEESVFPGFMIL